MSENSANIDIKAEVSGLYGPGVYVSWLLTIASAVLKIRRLLSRTTGSDGAPESEQGFLRHILTTEVLSILLYPVVAAGDVIVRLADESTDWDRIRTKCVPFNIFSIMLLRKSLAPEDSSPEFLSKCEGLRLPLGILQFFLTLDIAIGILLFLEAWSRFSSRKTTTLLNLAIILPPLWCLAVCISALAKAGGSHDSIAVFFVEGYLRVIGFGALFAVLVYVYFGALLTSVSLTRAVLEVRTAFNPRDMPPLSSRLFITENSWRLARVLYYLVLGTVPFGVALYGLRIYLFHETARALLFTDGVAGMHLTELDQVVSVLGGLVNLGYTLHSTGTVSRVTVFVADLAADVRQDWKYFTITHRFLLPRFLERG